MNIKYATLPEKVSKVHVYEHEEDRMVVLIHRRDAVKWHSHSLERERKKDNIERRRIFSLSLLNKIPLLVMERMIIYYIVIF